MIVVVVVVHKTCFSPFCLFSETTVRFNSLLKFLAFLSNDLTVNDASERRAARKMTCSSTCKASELKLGSFVMCSDDMAKPVVGLRALQVSEVRTYITTYHRASRLSLMMLPFLTLHLRILPKFETALFQKRLLVSCCTSIEACMSSSISC